MRSLALLCGLWVSCACAQDNLPGRIGYIQSNMNPQVIQEFDRAWQAARIGEANTECAILLFHKAEGLVAEGEGYTNEFDRFSFKWNPAAIAIVHTHRNKDGAKPSPADREVANKLGVPIFTITSRGMYVYDPEMKRVIKVQDGLDWLDASKWSTRSLTGKEPERGGDEGTVEGAPYIKSHRYKTGNSSNAIKQPHLGLHESAAHSPLNRALGKRFT